MRDHCVNGANGDVIVLEVLLRTIGWQGKLKAGDITNKVIDTDID